MAFFIHQDGTKKAVGKAHATFDAAVCAAASLAKREKYWVPPDYAHLANHPQAVPFVRNVYVTKSATAKIPARSAVAVCSSMSCQRVGKTKQGGITLDRIAMKCPGFTLSGTKRKARKSKKRGRR